MINVPKRRRREGKTDYKHRKRMLKGEKARVLFKKTNKRIIGQYVISKESQDYVIITANSGELLAMGWPKEWEGSLKSLPAAYLTGLLLGKKIKDNDKTNNEGVLDLGLYRNVKKSRIYAYAKGIIDAGIKMPVNEKMFPDKERIEGMHMKKDVKEVIEKITKKLGAKK
ncbi:50S ribosomal protein L18 [Candidatus Pacearchaeota archaeon CG10_big_fil_rev_8_21_14_0_10_35_13]|nr:MAG: 50S ribosomal protein L18 [Candidatus Pacearchaeota archaeon CG10_big_fil_rev_8_21_14_0_10_35_13]